MAMTSPSSSTCPSVDPFRWWENKLRKRKIKELNPVLATRQDATVGLQYDVGASIAKWNGDCLVSKFRLSCLQDSSESAMPLRATENSEVPKDGNLSEAFDAMGERLKEGVDAHIHQDLMLLMQRCIEEKNVMAGSRVLCSLLKDGLASDSLLRKQLIDMLCFLEGLQEAIEDYNELCTEDVFGWDVVISAHLKLGQNEKVLELYHAMKEVPVEPSRYIFVAVFKACGILEALDVGVSAHIYAIELGFDMDDIVMEVIIDMYCKLGLVSDARRIFVRLSERSCVSWNALIGGYCNNGDLQEALHLLQQMQQEGLNPSSSIFVGFLRLCSKSTALEEGKQLHASVIEGGVEDDLRISNALINMYAKCKAFEDACVVLDKVHMHDIITWNALITGYAQHGCFQEAFDVLPAMLQDNFWPDDTTYLSLLTACCSSKHVEKGKQLHASVLTLGFDLHLSVGNSLVNMYIKCGSFEDAKAVFNALPEKDVVSWNVMMRGYLEHEPGEEAIAALKGMQEAGIQPDHITFLSLLKVCSNMLALEEGRHIHSLIVQKGFDTETSIRNTLIDMYGKCGSLEDALLVFEKTLEKSIVTWNAMMMGYALHNQGQETLQLYLRVEQEGIKPDKVTYLGAIKACATLSALGWGKRIHDAIKQAGFATELSVTNTLIDMYAKCGSLKDAQEVFNASPTRNVVTWSVLISGYAEQSDYDTAVKLFYDMQRECIEPDGLAYLSLLSACSHKGLVEKGLFHLREMRDQHGIPETLEHLDCIVDLVGCRGLFDVAEDLLETMPFKDNIVGWLSLLGSCRLHINVEVARRCFDYVVAAVRHHPAAYVMMSSVYAKAGMYKEAEELEVTRIGKDAWKKAGQAYIEVEDRVHRFAADDKTHPQTLGIHSKLESLSWQAREQGLLSDSISLEALSSVAKQDLFCRHSEKLAVTFGLLNTPGDAPIRVAKNIRVCPDCHQAIKLISKIERREIIVKDVDCIHNFRDGACSCEDRYYVNSGRKSNTLTKN